MNPIAAQLNETLDHHNPHLIRILSRIGQTIFFPKGILSQSAEAKQQAHRINATIGIATEAGKTMHFSSVMAAIRELPPEQALTYAPSFGIPELRKVWQDALYEKNPSLAGKSISLPVVTCGITHGLSVLADIWVDPDDIVVMPEMLWGNYQMILKVRKGARFRQYPIFSPAGGFNLAGFEQCLHAAAKERQKLIVLLNFPHNPSGYTVTEAEGQTLAGILKAQAEAGTDLVVICDDAYFGLFYEADVMAESLFAKLCGLHPRLVPIKADGATKENFVWGLRIGFITYGPLADPPEPVHDVLERKTAGTVRGSISNASHLGQSLVLRSMQNREFPEEKQEKFEILRRRAKRIKAVLADPKYAVAWEPYPFNSGYFMCLKLKTVDAESLRVHLLKTYGVGLIAIGEKNLRIAFSCVEEEQIAELFDTILQGVFDLEKAS